MKGVKSVLACMLPFVIFSCSHQSSFKGEMLFKHMHCTVLLNNINTEESCSWKHNFRTFLQELFEYLIQLITKYPNFSVPRIGCISSFCFCGVGLQNCVAFF